MSRQAVNYLLGQIEELGYLERRTDPADQRSKLITLTPRGRKIIPVMRNAMIALEREWSTGLGPARFADLRSLLIDLSALAATTPIPAHQGDLPHR